MFDIYIINNSADERAWLRRLLVRFQIERNIELQVEACSFGTEMELPLHTALFLVDTSDDGVQKMILSIRAANRENHIMLLVQDMQQILRVMTPETLPSGFLVKPVQYKDLVEQLKLLEHIETKRRDESDTVFCQTVKARTIRIPYNKILYFTSRNKKTYLVTSTMEYEIYKTLDVLERELGEDFLRIHRGYLVNRAHIQEYNFGTMILLMDDGTVTYISRTGKERIRQVMK